MKRSEDEVYSVGGKLYGKGQALSAADLDKIKPLKGRKAEEPADAEATGSVTSTGAVVPSETSTSAPTYTEEQLEGMSIKELKDIAKSRDVKVKAGSKKPAYVAALAG